MKHIVIERPGGHAALALSQVPDSVPGPGQVRVRVKASGVNYADAIVRMGHYEAAKGLYPITPGFEFCGVVDAVGAGAKSFKAGDRVMGITRFGGYADTLCVDPAQLFSCPANWDDAQCAGFLAVFLTAYHGLFATAKVEAGETLLIHSAAGATGIAFLQLAKAFGCRALGVVGSSSKKQTALEFGAEAVIDRSEEDLWARVDALAPKGLDAVFDSSGVSTLRPAFERLRAGGRLVVFGFADILPRGNENPSMLSMARNYLSVPKFSPLEMTGTNRSLMGFNVVYLFDKMPTMRKGLERIFQWIAEGKVRPLPTATFPAENVAQAHAAIESGKTTGKLVLSWS